MTTVSDSSVRPTMIIGADSRFGTTFLSTKYRDRAVSGEALMDKTSGELFIKRVSDGKIVSFYQNKKMLNDMAFDLRLLLLDNPTFIYPYKNEKAFYISTNYDLIAINNEVPFDLTTDDISIPGAPNDINKLSFIITGESNGFFCRNTTRDVDKAFIEFITNQYDNTIKNYTGNDESYLAEYDKFQNNEHWENSNAVLTFDVIVNKNGIEYQYLDNTSYIILNDDVPVFLPEKIYTDLTEFDYATINIKSITYDKLHFMINHIDEFDSVVIDAYNKLISNDNRIEVAEFNVCYFINNANDIEILGNESIIALLDIHHINRYLSKMSKLLGINPLVVSPSQPDTSCMWFKPIIN